MLGEIEAMFIAKFQAAKAYFQDGIGDPDEAMAACDFVNEVASRFLPADHAVRSVTKMWNT